MSPITHTPRLPQNLAQAKALYLGSKIQKEFDVGGVLQLFTGTITDIWASYHDEATGRLVKCTPQNYQYQVE